MKTVAITCAKGLGDGLLMMIVAHQLKQAGMHPTLFHDSPAELATLFPHIPICPHPPLTDLKTTFSPFDVVVVENDHSKRAYALDSFRRKEQKKSFYFLLPTSSPLYQKGDFLFDSYTPVASNLRLACQSLFGFFEATKDNGITLPLNRTYRLYPNRIVFHPTSQDPKRNWNRLQFMKLAKMLQEEGFVVSFSVSLAERSEWLFTEEEGFDLPLFSNLSELAAYLYESGYLIGNDSGIGHLASNLKIPTLTISGNPKRVRLWRPDWCQGEVVTPFLPLPNFKGIHLAIRQNFWQHFIPVSRTMRAFHRLKKHT